MQTLKKFRIEQNNDHAEKCIKNNFVAPLRLSNRSRKLATADAAFAESALIIGVNR